MELMQGSKIDSSNHIYVALDGIGTDRQWNVEEEEVFAGD